MRLDWNPCPHAIKALKHEKVEPLSEMHWFYSKKAYLLVYKHKLQAVKGEKFWKIEPHHAMEPLLQLKWLGDQRSKGQEKRMRPGRGKEFGLLEKKGS